MNRRFWIGWTLSLLAVMALPDVAGSHAFLVKSIPARRAHLLRPPNRVQLWFNERLEPAYSTLSVTDANGKRVDSQDVKVGPEDPKLLSVPLPMLAPGTYTIRFRVLSVDGHVVESEYPFTVRSDRAKP
jgi:methionine-rich copper-binding protein CopC